MTSQEMQQKNCPFHLARCLGPACMAATGTNEVGWDCSIILFTYSATKRMQEIEQEESEEENG